MDEKTEQQTAATEGPGRGALVDSWVAEFGQRPPAKASREFLRRGLAYQAQASEFGGLPEVTQKRLNRLAAQVESDPSFAAPKERAPKAGTRLVREWQGQTHTVTVLDVGFGYLGRRYKSLSKIAREITGTRWSGPAFFGLNIQRRRGRNVG